MATREYQSYVKVNRVPFPSAATGDNVSVWASPEAAHQYLALDPKSPALTAPLPNGSTLVREVFDGTGNVKTLTIIIQGFKGYNADVCDLFFAITSPSPSASRETLVDNGLTERGRIQTCAGCHAGNASAGCLLGVSASAR
jgi:hypothetical protein